MSDSEPIQDYVTSQRTEGQFLGDGKFTLNPGEALRKLARFQLPQPSFWILKLLQAAVAQDCKSTVTLSLKQSRIEAVFEISENWTADLVNQAVLNPEFSSAQDSLGHLVQALRALAVQEDWEYELSLPKNGGCLRWRHGELSVSPGEALSILHLVARAPSTSHRSQPTYIKELRYLLITRGGLSPRPIIVNKKPISLVAYLVDQSLPVRSYYETYLLNIHLVEGPWPRFRLPGNLIQGVHVLHHPPGQTKPKPPQSPEGALLSLLCCKPKGGIEIRLAWVRDGVIAWERNVSFRGPGVTLQIYLSAEGHQTDLTGFRLAESDILKLHTYWALEQAKAELQRQTEAFAIQPSRNPSLTLWERFCISMQEQPDWSRKPNSGEKGLAMLKLFSGIFIPVGLLLLNDQYKMKQYHRQTETALQSLLELWPRVEKEFLET